MASIKIEYAASADLTATLASLAASSTLVAGREATSVSNSSNKYLDELLSGMVTTGTSPAAGKIEVWVIAKSDDTNWPDVFDGTDSAETATSRDILMACGRLAWSVVTDTTSNRAYHFSNVSIASLFGGSMPKEWTVFVTHSTTAALNATGGNHRISHTPVYATAA